jgi:eukaryotic-like serine/threonine-protein kinase
MALDTHGELLADRYRKLGAIGVGGMARVYLAEDELLGRRVAVKVLHADSPEDAAIRFEREAKLGASLNHPNLVSIFDIVTDAEAVLIVMEYVDGETLRDAIARGPLSPERTLAVVCDMAAALDHAHSHGVVHRDVKPANILLRHDGIAKLADLGIATAAERTAITHSGVVLGTASYMAPEQLSGGEAGPRSDVYALAAVAFEALSGKKARSGKTPVEVAHEVVSGSPPDLEQVWEGASPEAAAALARGMAREPGDRPASAGALAAELERGLRLRPSAVVAGGTGATAPMPATRGSVNGRSGPPMPAHVEREPSRPLGSRRGWWPAAAVTALILLVAAGALVALRGGDDPSGAGADRERPAASDRSAADRSTPERANADRPAVGTGDGGSAAAPDAGADDDAGAPTPPAVAPPASGPVSDDPVELNDQGYALMQDGRYDEAIPVLQRAVDAFPEGSQELTYAYALYNLGRSLRLAGRAAEAVPVLERRLRIPNQTQTVEQELEAARQAAG